MFCQKCGHENNDDTKFCTNCGVNVVSIPMNFGKAISTCLSKYFNFKGRASRSEFWWFYLFFVILSLVPDIFDHTQTISTIFNVVLGFPVISVSVRRLHDTNHSGWWLLLSLTIIGIIPLIILWARRSDNHENRFGSIIGISN